MDPNRKQPEEPSPFDRLAQSLQPAPGGERETQAAPRREAAQPDPSEVERLTASVKREWGLGDEGARPTASAAPPTSEPGAFERAAIDITRHVGLRPGAGNGPGAWHHVSSGIRDGLGDFVSRVLLGEPSPGEPRQPEPTPGNDRGFDR